MSTPKIYTKQGDQGQTRLPDGHLIPKDVAPLEACGTIDELGAVLGMARTEGLPDDLDAIILRVQHELFELNSEIADPSRAKRPEAIGPGHSRRLEEDIDRLEAELKPLTNFILAGGTPAAATLHLARTVCRRAERRLVALGHGPWQPPTAAALVYLNRLSDLLFVLARAANTRSQRDDEVARRVISSAAEGGVFTPLRHGRRQSRGVVFLPKERSHRAHRAGRPGPHV